MYAKWLLRLIPLITALAFIAGVRLQFAWPATCENKEDGDKKNYSIHMKAR